ncbi:probable E3 ubiquitin-protein ligase DTX3 [Argopecten irradians]|uniref:probable E3 ubiquitin-protein ligase DTX3 n=1 Tax=Argopecten irradians TaxID=31199 RepID=UPI00371DDBD9
MSILSSESLETRLYVEKCSEVMFRAIDDFTRRPEMISLMEIHLVDLREDHIKVLKDTFHKQKPVCPVCGTVYTVVQGNQPVKGVAEVYKDDKSLPGYPGHKTFIINYDFPDGKQGEEHPEPGEEYKGLNRQAYLPDNTQGQRVLKMLKEAFEQRLIFTVGQSSTTGEVNVVTWNDICHKTCREGGPERFGYPDDEYLDRVTDELNAKGIGL